MSRRPTTPPPTPANLKPVIEGIVHVLSTPQSRDAAWRGGFAEGDEFAIAILGPRGSGKTTLLAAVCRELERSKKAIVLPVLQPEVFESTDSLVLALLLKIESRFLLTSSGGTARSVQESSLGLALREAIRSASAASAGAFHALAMSSETAGQYGVEATSLLRHREALGRALEELANAIRIDSDAPAGQPIVVPIDDADLAPANLQQVLSTIRLLGRIPDVYPVICADREQLTLAVQSSLATDYGRTLPLAKHEELARQILTKLIRPERTFAPPWLDAAARIDFVPFGGSRSIRNLAEEFSKRFGAELIWRSTSQTLPSEPATVNGWLPETPRELEHLWFALDRFLSAPSRGHSDQVDIYSVNRLISALLGGTSEFSVSARPRMANAVGRGVHSRLHLDWDGVENLGISAQGEWRHAATSRQVEVRLRRFGRIRAIPPRDTQQGDADQGPRPSLSDRSTSLVQLVQELAISGVEGLKSSMEPGFLGAEEAAFLQAVNLQGRRTDDRFLLFPESCGLTAQARVFTLWNRMVLDAAAISRRCLGDASYLVRRHIYLIVNYWLLGKTKSLHVAQLPSLTRLLEFASDEYLRRISALGDLESTGRYNQDAAYCRWFETSLPATFHADFLPKKATYDSVNQWVAATAAAGRGSVARQEMRDLFMGRFASRFETERRKQDGESSWIYGYRALADVLGGEAQGDVAMFREHYYERRRSRGMGRDVLFGAVALSQKASRYSYAPRRTVEGDRDLALIREVLQQYLP